MALHDFHDTYQCLPAAVRRDELGRPLSSWRFQLSMYVEAWMLDVSFGDRWDDPQNRWLAGEPLSIYCLYPDRDPPDNLHTNVVAIAGPGTVFEEGREYRLGQFDSDTIVAIEVADFDVCWAEPGDLHIDDVNGSILPARTAADCTCCSPTGADPVSFLGSAAGGSQTVLHD